MCKSMNALFLCPLGNGYECNFRTFCPEVQIEEIKEEHEMCIKMCILWVRAPTDRSSRKIYNRRTEQWSMN